MFDKIRYFDENGKYLFEDATNTDLQDIVNKKEAQYFLCRASQTSEDYYVLHSTVLDLPKLTKIFNLYPRKYMEKL